MTKRSYDYFRFKRSVARLALKGIGYTRHKFRKRYEWKYKRKYYTSCIIWGDPIQISGMGAVAHKMNHMLYWGVKAPDNTTDGTE